VAGVELVEKRKGVMAETRERMQDPIERDKLVEAIVRHKGVVAAATELGLHAPTLYIESHKNPELKSALTAAREMQWQVQIDDGFRIADDTTIEPKHKYAMLDWRIRMCGKVAPHIWGEKPSTQVNVGVQVNQVDNEETRQRLIELREKIQEGHNKT